MRSCPSQQCRSERTPEARTRRVGGASRELGYDDSPPPVSWGKHTGTARKPAAGREAGSRETSHTVPRVACPDTTLAHLLGGKETRCLQVPASPFSINSVHSIRNGLRDPPISFVFSFGAKTVVRKEMGDNQTSTLGRLWQALPGRRVARASTGDQVRDEDRWDLETARAAAVREVAALLAKPDNLGRVGKLKAEYETQRSAVQVRAGWRKVLTLLRAGKPGLAASSHRLSCLCACAQVQISMLTGRQAEEARAGIDLLARCRDNVQQVRVWRPVAHCVRARVGACGRCGLTAVGKKRR